MNGLGVNQLSSSLVLNRTHHAHYSSQRAVQDVTRDVAQNARVSSDGGVARGSFAELLQNGIAAVNDTQQNHEALAQLAITNPDQVDVHDVTIAAAKADLSIRLARSIIDRTLNGYREITSLR